MAAKKVQECPEELDGILRWPELLELILFKDREKCSSANCSECVEAKDCPRAVV